MIKETYDRILITMPSTLNKKVRIHINITGKTFSGFIRSLAEKELRQKNKRR